MIHYINDIMIQGETEQDVQQLELILQNMKNKGRKINPDKIQEYLVHFIVLIYYIYKDI